MGEHKIKKTLKQIFSHPIPTNIEWKNIENLLEHKGFKIENTKKNHMKIKSNSGQELVLIVHGHEINSKDEIVKLKHFLQENGISEESIL
ncbi:hypothetical protein [Nitrosophilus kaiyonis]|uniref:hypothetical protein n=1 Tax=Nitrosophilus kaiyonis TaxID=2930200 RepID=UPI00249123E0|nr:hypothetical protein [Nitrosophilus kaiyonis]